ncbi:flavodoxin domain-containing protein [Lentzea flaviverrucosa]|uniref:Flavodoxin domain-containing protein n=1 Tax=Lentzea flaviverrucosa TaxID=200379 RepID=A0A1H9XY18_9PSEU|nr:flavodoxin domain-containing protein [Lentzea flaviverrucosa]RDI28009.1 flavodoxin-like protein [Lentzea flaviverrucosa]SES51085.1 Flavodoxin domain-containing protein [Lentzea flaviverrucosa]
MTDRVLVAYTSKTAATDEIAEIIGTELAGCGLRVTVLPVAAAESLHGFGAVILGDAAARDAHRFVKRHRVYLKHTPIWLFHRGTPPVPNDVTRMVRRLGASGPISFGGEAPDWDRAQAWARYLADQLAVLHRGFVSN